MTGVLKMPLNLPRTIPAWLCAVLSVVLSLTFAPQSHAQQPVKTNKLAGQFTPPKINMRLLGQGLAMANTERDEYATNLGAYASEVVQAGKGSQKSLEAAERILGLALHLSPRNKKSLVVNAQLRRGILPKTVAADYGKDVFSKLLLTRAQLLEKQKGATNMLLARYFVSLAADMDPGNEDALFEDELRRIDQGKLDWSLLTDGKKPSVTENN